MHFVVVVELVSSWNSRFFFK